MDTCKYKTKTTLIAHNTFLCLQSIKEGGDALFAMKQSQLQQ